MLALLRTSLQLIAWAALGLVLASPAGAGPIVSVVFTSSTGAGITGSDAIAAAPGDVLGAELRVTAGAEGISSYGISILFDVDLANELDVVSVEEKTPPGFALSFTPGGIERVDESSATRRGAFLTFEAATPGLGPASTSFVVGRVRVRVTDRLDEDGVALTPGLFHTGVDGLFDNQGRALDDVAIFGSGVIRPVPEPAPSLLVGLGLAGLALGSRVRRVGGPPPAAPATHPGGGVQRSGLPMHSDGSLDRALHWSIARSKAISRERP
jgi:hypothetical protein